MLKRQYLPIFSFVLIVLVFTAGTKSILNDAKKEIDLIKMQSESLQWSIDTLKEANELLRYELQKERDYIQELLEENEALRTIRARVTAYSPMDNQSGICADSEPTVTATGKTPSRGIIAVDPNKVPYGTRIFIPGYGEGVAEDTGGLIRAYDGVAIDLVMESYAEAMAWGVQKLDVFIQR